MKYNEQLCQQVRELFNKYYDYVYSTDDAEQRGEWKDTFCQKVIKLFAPTPTEQEGKDDWIKVEDGLLVIKQDDFEHLPDRSVYNNNYYKHKKLGYTIYEKCQDDTNESSFYLMEDETMVFLGDSFDSGFWDGQSYVKINFKQYFT